MKVVATTPGSGVTAAPHTHDTAGTLNSREKRQARSCAGALHTGTGELGPDEAFGIYQPSVKAAEGVLSRGQKLAGPVEDAEALVDESEALVDHLEMREEVDQVDALNGGVEPLGESRINLDDAKDTVGADTSAGSTHHERNAPPALLGFATGGLEAATVWATTVDQAGGVTLMRALSLVGVVVVVITQGLFAHRSGVEENARREAAASAATPLAAEQRRVSRNRWLVATGVVTALIAGMVGYRTYSQLRDAAVADSTMTLILGLVAMAGALATPVLLYLSKALDGSRLSRWIETKAGPQIEVLDALAVAEEATAKEKLNEATARLADFGMRRAQAVTKANTELARGRRVMTAACRLARRPVPAYTFPADTAGPADAPAVRTGLEHLGVSVDTEVLRQLDKRAAAVRARITRIRYRLSDIPFQADDAIGSADPADSLHPDGALEPAGAARPFDIDRR